MRVTQEFLLWHFHIYTWCTLGWLIPSIILSSLTPLLQMTSTGVIVPYSYMYRKYLNHIHLLYPLCFPSPSPSISLLSTWPVYTPLLLWFSVFSLFNGVLPWQKTFNNQIAIGLLFGGKCNYTIKISPRDITNFPFIFEINLIPKIVNRL
jgi:hypothetical protein